MQALASGGRVIEDYPGDQRGASCLMLAVLADGTRRGGLWRRALAHRDGVRARSGAGER